MACGVGSKKKNRNRAAMAGFASSVSAAAKLGQTLRRTYVVKHCLVLYLPEQILDPRPISQQRMHTVDLWLHPSFAVDMLWLSGSVSPGAAGYFASLSVHSPSVRSRGRLQLGHQLGHLGGSPVPLLTET